MVFFTLPMISIFLLFLVEDGGVNRISIVYSGNSMSPSSFESSFSLPKKNMILFKILECVKFVFNVFDVLSRLFWTLQVDRFILLKRSIQTFFCFIQQLYLLRNLSKMFFSLNFKNSFLLQIPVFEALFISNNLHRGRSVHFVSVYSLFVVFPTH